MIFKGFRNHFEIRLQLIPTKGVRLASKNKTKNQKLLEPSYGKATIDQAYKIYLQIPTQELQHFPLEITKREDAANYT